MIDNTPKEEKKETFQKPYYPVQDSVVTDTPISSTDKQEETAEYKKLSAKETELETLIERQNNIMLEFDKKIKNAETAINPHKHKKAEQHYKTSSDVYLLRDFFESEMEEGNNSEHEFEAKRLKAIQALEKERVICQEIQNKNKVSLKNVKEILSKTPRYEKPFKSLWKSFLQSKQHGTDKIPAQPLSNTNEIKEPEMKVTENSVDITDEILKNNPWIINSEDLFKVKRSRLNFQGKWKDFLGQPGTDFHLAVHGSSGQGKSTMCFQFAKYLADNFGRVVFIANEEHTDSVTFEDKVNQANAVAPNLKYVNMPSYEFIQERVPGIFNFIFLDSLNTLEITPQRLRELKAHYANAAFITISRETKGGKMMGSNEILHDSDIIVEVAVLMGTTTKNRYKEIGQQFFIREKKMGEEKNKGGSGLKNVI